MAGAEEQVLFLRSSLLKLSEAPALEARREKPFRRGLLAAAEVMSGSPAKDQPVEREYGRDENLMILEVKNGSVNFFFLLRRTADCHRCLHTTFSLLQPSAFGEVTKFPPQADV